MMSAEMRKGWSGFGRCNCGDPQIRRRRDRARADAGPVLRGLPVRGPDRGRVARPRASRRRPPLRRTLVPMSGRGGRPRPPRRSSGRRPGSGSGARRVRRGLARDRRRSPERVRRRRASRCRAPRRARSRGVVARGRDLLRRLYASSRATLRPDAPGRQARPGRRTGAERERGGRDPTRSSWSTGRSGAGRSSWYTRSPGSR